MRIDFHSGPQSANETERTRAQTTASAERSSRSEVPSGEDQAQLSGAHVQVQALAAQASQLPEIREEKVQSLRQAIEGGKYRSDPEQVAGAMLAHMIAGSAA